MTQRWLETALLLSWLVGNSVYGAAVLPPSLKAQNAALQAVEKWGGTVVRDRKVEGRPVIGVDLHKTEVTDAGLKELLPLQGLQTLILTRCDQLTDEGLQRLKQFPELRELQLNGTQVTDAGLTKIKKLRGLQILGLASTWVTDAGLKEVKPLQRLQTLILSGNRVTDAGLTELKGLKELRKLLLRGTWVTAEGVKDLKETLPKVLIEN